MIGRAVLGPGTWNSNLCCVKWEEKPGMGGVYMRPVLAAPEHCEPGLGAFLGCSQETWEGPRQGVRRWPTKRNKAWCASPFCENLHVCPALSFLLFPRKMHLNKNTMTPENLIPNYGLYLKENNNNNNINLKL